MCSTAKAIIEHHRLKASAAKSQSLSRSASAGGLTLSRPTAAVASSSSSCSSSTTAAATSTSSSSTLSRPTTTTMMMADCSGSASSSNNTLTMSAHRMRRAGSSGLIGYHTDCSDDDLESSSHSHVLDRVKSDRMPVTKPEEDRRRRTIIVEKKNHSYGFTLQSYGIHYKKEQEIEMITYVDYVEYDGPAYRSGMREGDVILSINGVDMEKADHKTLVAFIKACDTRMRMVVLFEDCVRKVELHMRYIQLQTVLQGKMNELERTCLRERELLEGKWKTHSLPARKRASATADAQTPADEATSPGADESAPAADSDVPTASPFCRPALSTEDVHQLGRHYRHQYGGVHGHHHQPLPLHYQPLHQLQTIHGVGSATAVIPPPAQFMLTYQYLDPHCRYVLRPSLLLSRGSSGSGGGGGHHHHHHHHHQQQQQQQQTPPNGEYYHLNVSPAQAGRTHRKSPSEDHPMTNFGSNESTDEILSDAHPSATQQRHHPHHHHHQSSSAATAAATATESNYAHGKHHQSTAGAADAQKVAATTATTAPTAGRTTKSSSRHCHSGHSCNPCLGHRSKDKSSAAANGGSGAAGGDNVSLDAYDLASPCCDPHCVPTRRRTRHHKDHHHRHKHRDKDQKDAQQQQQQQQQRAQRPRSQSHAASPSMLHANAGGVSSAVQSPHHQRYNDKCQNHRPRFYDITAGLATHCSLHSCTSSEQPLQASANSGVHCVHAGGGGGGGGGGAESSAASYTTSLSTDTLYWDPELSSGIGGGGGGGGHSRQQSTKSRQSAATVSSVYHPQASIQSQQQYVHQQQQLQQQQQRYHHVQPAASAAGAYECHQTSTAASAPYMNGKPKSWDNLAMKGIGGYGFGYSYLDAGNQMSVAGKPPVLGGVNPLVAGSAAGAKPLPTGGVQHQLFSQQQQQQQQRHSIPRKNPYGRYSTFSDVENYAPPPSQFVHATITTTTITKSTENLIGGGAMNHSDTSLHSCDGCNEPPAGAGGTDSGGGGVSYVAQMQSMSPASQALLQQQQQPKHHDCRGYYSHLPRARIGSSNSGTNGGGGEPGAGSGSAAGSATNSMSRVPAGNSGGHVATVSEVTRL